MGLIEGGKKTHTCKNETNHTIIVYDIDKQKTLVNKVIKILFIEIRKDQD